MTPEWMTNFEPLREPAAISWWPPAPGWWLLLAATLILIALVLRHWRHYRQYNRYRVDLARELDRLWRKHRPDRHPAAIPPYLAACCESLRRTWLLLEPACASLPAPALLSRLEDTPGIRIPAGLLLHIESLLYSPTPDTAVLDKRQVTEFHRQLLRWSRRHSGRASC